MASDEQVYALTQQVLQSPADPLVDKPKLTSKLLAKPPFRFLHDVISAVQAKTGFAPGLYTGTELDAHAIQDKDMKIKYLSKMMALVSLVLQQPVPAKPHKVVAGLEPEKTNLFLQMLGAAARMTDAAHLVQAVLTGAEPLTEQAAAPPHSQQLPATAASLQQPPPSSHEEGIQQQQQLARERVAKQEPEQRQAPQKTHTPPQQQQQAAATEPAAATAAEAVPGRQWQQVQPLLGELQLPRPASGGGRPMSAKKAPPRINSPSSSSHLVKPAGVRPVSRGPSGGRPAPDRPMSAAAAAERGASAGREGSSGRRGTTGALGHDGSDDDAEEATTPAWMQFGLPQAGSAHATTPAAAAPGAACGVLVKDILSTAQQLEEAGAEQAAAGADRGAAEGPTGIILSRQAKSAAAAGGRDQSVLSAGAVQRLCQVVLPLGRTLEFLHADVDSSMSKEFRFWASERRMYQDRLAAEQGAHDLSALQAELSAKDTAIRAAQDSLAALRCQVLHDAAHIARLLRLSVGEP